MKKACAIAALITIIFFTSCQSSRISSGNFYGGESVNPDILSEMAESFFIDDPALPYEPEHTEIHNGIFYWTESGSVYHKYPDCGHIKGSAEIRTGSEQDAVLAGKDHLCSSCAKR